MAQENPQTKRAIRNIGHRPLSLTFANETVRVLPRKTSEFYPMSTWKAGHGFAFEQATKFVSDREAVWVDEKPNIKEAGVSDLIPSDNT